MFWKQIYSLRSSHCISSVMLAEQNLGEKAGFGGRWREVSALWMVPTSLTLGAVQLLEEWGKEKG